jgi:hypothetical protein
MEPIRLLGAFDVPLTRLFRCGRKDIYEEKDIYGGRKASMMEKDIYAHDVMYGQPAFSASVPAVTRRRQAT